MNLPNALTWLRVGLIPVFVMFFLIPKEWGYTWTHIVVTALFVIAAITDWLDGYLARKWNQTSNFGAFLDPVADKLMVVAAIILIVYDAGQKWYIVIPAIVIISREITISALREWMATLGARGVVAVSWIGKWKTAMQMVALTCLLYKQPLFGINMYYVGLWGLLIATILTLWSMIQYLIDAWKVLK